MVTAVSAATTLNPKRRPLCPSEAENGQPRRPKSREVSSRYLLSSSSKTSSSSNLNSSKQRQTPNVTRTERSQGMPAQNSATVSRSRSVGRGRPEMSAATKLLLTSTRSSSVSFQGESLAKPAKKFPNRFDTSEKIEQQRWPGRTKPANSSLNNGAMARMENPKPIDQLRSLGRSKSINSSLLTRSLDCGKACLSQKSVTDEINQFRIETKVRPEVYNVEPHSPVSRKNGYTTLATSKQIDNKKSLYDSRVSSLRDISATRGFSSYLRGGGRFRSGSPIKTSTPPSTSYQLRGSSSPIRARVGAVITMTNNVADTPSTLSFASDVRGKAGEKNWFADVHELRLLYNRHLQWRFVNAKIDAACFKLTETAEWSLYNVQLATSKLLHSVKSKQTDLLLLKQNLKLYCILKGQVPYFENWVLINKEHCSSLSAVICAMEACTIRLPVVSGARADIQKLKSAICSAVDVMQAMASSICLLQSKVEQISSLLIELSSTVSSEHSSLHHCKDLLSTVTDMQVKHYSLRTHLLQLIDTPYCSTRL